MKLAEVVHTKYANPDVFDKVYNWVEDHIHKILGACGNITLCGLKWF